MSRVKELDAFATQERLRTIRTWLTITGVGCLLLAIMALKNTVGNPKTWASAYNALAAAGSFATYGFWLAAIGFFFLVSALGISVLADEGPR